MAQLTEGTRFGVYNGDAKGTVIEANTQVVKYNYDHALETVWERPRKDFDSNTFLLEGKN